jgi:hypothetical protein
MSYALSFAACILCGNSGRSSGHLYPSMVSTQSIQRASARGRLRINNGYPGGNLRRYFAAGFMSAPPHCVRLSVRHVKWGRFCWDKRLPQIQPESPPELGNKRGLPRGNRLNSSSRSITCSLHPEPDAHSKGHPIQCRERPMSR